MSNQIKKVSEQDIDDAINYLHTKGYVEDMTSDKKYYVEILLKAVANQFGIDLGLDK